VAAKRIENPIFSIPFEITNADMDMMVQGSVLPGMVGMIARLDRDEQADLAQPGNVKGDRHTPDAYRKARL
jgi:hypothetical protein